MVLVSPRGKRHSCCVGGWIYDDCYGFVVCADHEREAAENKEPDSYFIGWFKTWQPPQDTPGSHR